MSAVTSEVAQAEAQRRVQEALNHLQAAQDQLAHACAALSALQGGVPVWKATSKLYDSVHSLWYRVENFRLGGRYRLDGTNLQALERRLLEGQR